MQSGFRGPHYKGERNEHLWQEQGEQRQGYVLILKRACETEAGTHRHDSVIGEEAAESHSQEHTLNE